MKNFRRVTTRNFLKTKVESFQVFQDEIGVPKGTISPFFALFEPDRIKQFCTSKSALLFGKLLVLAVVISGHGRTCQIGKGLRKSYESLFVLQADRPDIDLFQILPSATFFANFISNFKTVHGGTNALV